MRQIFISLTLLFGSAAVQSATLVAPNGYEEENTGGNNCLLIGCTSNTMYQQFYAADQFSALSGPQYITHIAFRPAVYTVNDFPAGFRPPGDGPWPQRSVDYTLEDIEFSLSTTTSAIDSLSTTFGDNTGVDETSVFRGAFRVVYDGSLEAANTFSVILELDRHFLYDPSMGNLLMQIELYSPHPNYDSDTDTYSPFFFQAVRNDGVTERVYGSSGDEVGQMDVDYNNLLPHYGFVTQFKTSVVPIPAAVWLFGSALVSLGWMRRQQS